MRPPRTYASAKEWLWTAGADGWRGVRVFKIPGHLAVRRRGDAEIQSATLRGGLPAPDPSLIGEWIALEVVEEMPNEYH